MNARQRRLQQSFDGLGKDVQSYFIAHRLQPTSKSMFDVEERGFYFDLYCSSVAVFCPHLDVDQFEKATSYLADFMNFK